MKIGPKVLYIIHLSEQYQTQYQSLIIQIGACPIKSKESTSEIMQRFFEFHQVAYDTIKYFGKVLGISQRCPYLVGDWCFVPEDGTQRNKNTSWIGLHHVEDIDQEPQLKRAYVLCRSSYILILPISESSFQKQVEHAAKLYDIQHWLLKLFSTYFYTTVELRVQFPQELNILQRYFLQKKYQLPKLKLGQLMGYVLYYSAKKSLMKTLGVEHPDLQSSIANLDIPFFKKGSKN